MRLYYLKPELRDLSQGSRIAFIRQFRHMTQDEVSSKLGLTGECKRRSMTRYEKGDRNPKVERTLEIAKILDVNVDSIKDYDYKSEIDLFYTFLWIEELIPNYDLDLSKVNLKNKNFHKFIDEWNIMKMRKKNKTISWEEYIEWKINYRIRGNR